MIKQHLRIDFPVVMQLVGAFLRLKPSYVLLMLMTVHLGLHLLT